MDKVPEGRRAFGKLRYAFTRRSSSIFLSSSAVVAACGVRVAADIADGGGLSGLDSWRFPYRASWQKTTRHDRAGSPTIRTRAPDTQDRYGE